MARTTAGLFAAIVAFPAMCLAQGGHPEPQPRPAPKPIAPSTKTPPPPKDDSIPGLEDADFRITPAPLRREGSFIVRQRGSIVRLPGGQRAFIFHKDAAGRSERPMVLVPCLTLQTMEQSSDDRAGEAVFLVTGQVYAYHNVNYLLPTAAPIAPVVEGEAPKAQQPKSAPSPDSAAQTDPAVQDLIHELELQRDRPRTLGSGPAEPPASSRPSGKPEGSPTRPVDLLAENSAVSLKRGRMVRLSGGEWAFSVDNGPSAEASTDRILVLSPCLNLQRMEAWAQQLGDNASLILSGRVYQYQGRNHIVPTMYQVAPTAELSPRQ